MSETAYLPLSGPGRQPSEQGARILVVAEDVQTQALLAGALADASYDVRTSDAGWAAIADAAEGYDLVVLDLSPATPDWLDLLGELSRRRPCLRLLILSRHSDTAAVLRAVRLGASDFLLKPFSLDELLLRVRAAMRRPAVGDASHARRLVLDVAQHRARLGDRAVDLSAREFGLLHLLAGNAGEIVSRERLLADVWGYESAPDSNVVDACVRRLRRKLGAEAPIETVRGLGYRLSGP